MKKIIILSALTALTLTTANADIFLGTFKMKTMPMDQKYLSVERGGTLTAAQAYSDGVGVIVIGGSSATTPDNTPMNTLVKKYGEAAANEGEPLYTYVLNNAKATATEKALAQQLQNDLANSTTTTTTACITKTELENMIANNEDYSNVCTSNITDFSYLFYGKSVNYDISNWDVSNATNMTAMFAGSNFNQDISNWNVSNVTSMGSMFSDSPFNQDIRNWNVSNVTDFTYMFSGSSAFNQNISSWNVSNGTTFGSMFQNNTIFNQDLSSWTQPAGADSTSFDYNTPSWTLPKPTFN